MNYADLVVSLVSAMEVISTLLVMPVSSLLSCYILSGRSCVVSVQYCNESFAACLSGLTWKHQVLTLAIVASNQKVTQRATPVLDAIIQTHEA